MSRSTALPAGSTTIAEDRRGQTFIEAMVAITIIVSSVTSALSLVQSSITSTRLSGSQVIAANLAREGLEVIRSVRDSNWLAGNAFQFGLTDGTEKTARIFLDTDTGGWSLDFGPADLDDDVTRLYILAGGAYVHADPAPAGSRTSPYHRRVIIDHICRDNGTGQERIVTDTELCLSTETLVGLAATVQVRFPGIGGNTRTVSAEERFYDWR